MSASGSAVLVAVLSAASLPPVGQVLSMDADWEAHRLPLLLLRWYGRRVLGFVNLCPHMSVTLNRPGAGAFDRERRHLVCATHGAVFRPEDGRCVSGPCAGDHLDPVEVVEFFGHLQVFLPGALADSLRGRRRLVSALGPLAPAPRGPSPAGPDGHTPD